MRRFLHKQHGTTASAMLVLCFLALLKCFPALGNIDMFNRDTGISDMTRKSVLRVALAVPFLFFCLVHLTSAQERVPVGHHCAEGEQGNIVCSK